jgi:hypothetical protein
MKESTSDKRSVEFELPSARAELTIFLVDAGNGDEPVVWRRDDWSSRSGSEPTSWVKRLLGWIDTTKGRPS